MISEILYFRSPRSSQTLPPLAKADHPHERAGVVRGQLFWGCPQPERHFICFQPKKDILHTTPHPYPKSPGSKLAKPLLFRLPEQFHPWGGNRAWNDLEQKDNFWTIMSE